MNNQRLIAEIIAARRRWFEKHTKQPHRLIVNPEAMTDLDCYFYEHQFFVQPDIMGMQIKVGRPRVGRMEVR